MMTLFAPESNAACNAAVESSAFHPNDEAFTVLSAPAAPSEQSAAAAIAIRPKNVFPVFIRILCLSLFMVAYSTAK